MAYALSTYSNTSKKIINMADWMITVRPPFSRWLVEGKKTMEIRTRIPKDLCIDDFIYVVEAESGGKVVGAFLVKEIFIGHPCFIAKPYYNQHKVPYEMFCKYVGTREKICALKLELRHIPTFMVNVKDYGLTRAPQWFTKLPN